jgi:hypothetical protein
MSSHDGKIETPTIYENSDRDWVIWEIFKKILAYLRSSVANENEKDQLPPAADE